MYAKDTSVPVERTRQEIERLVQKYGAEQYASGWDGDTANVGFRMKGRMVQFRMPLPKVIEGRYVQGKWVAGNGITATKLPQLTRSRWRALLLVLKAKLEAVESGISDFETEFLGNVIMGGGQTVADWAKPQLAELYSRNRPLALMPGVSE